MTRVVLVPGVLALLPAYASLEDPVAELRAACLSAVAWLGPDVVVLGDEQGTRVGSALLAACGGFETGASAPSSTTDVVDPLVEQRALASVVETPEGEAGRLPASSTEGVDSVVEQRALASVVETPEGEAGRRPPSYLVVGNGTARRTEKAPGHLDERAAAYDDALRAALTSSDAKWPDFQLGKGLLASLDGIARLPEVVPAGTPAQVDYDDDPYGVQYWVIRWQA